MSNQCSCTLGKLNTQQNSCPSIAQIAKRLIIVPKFKADGTVNEITNVAGVTKAALQAKFDANDIDDRWFPLSELKNVVEEKADTVNEEFTDKSLVPIDEGKRSFTGAIINQGSKLLEKLESWACQEFGVYVIDKNSNFIYITDSATKLKVQPIAVDQNSWRIKYIKATDTTVAKLEIKFDFAMNMQDKYLREIASEDLDFDGLNTADVYALYTCSGVVSGLSTTGCTMTITTDYGLPVKNLLITDFFDTHGGTNSKLYNVTDSAAVTIATFAETADGVYAFTFIAQTPADVLRCTPDKSHYDFAGVVSATITIP